MKLRRIEVTDFGTVASAQVELRDGLNVLYGPNDLGKSTMAAAVRAALLLQHGSSAARPYIPWGTKRKPQVAVTLEIEGRLWRVHKVFGTSSGGKSVLEWSNDGNTYTLQEEGRGVDGKLRELLGWGLAAPGGRGGSHGFPKSFLATVLLGEQAMPYRLLSESLQSDAEDTGKARLVEALEAMATDPVYMHVLEAAQAKVDEAFTARGKRSTRKGSPFERVSSEIRQRRESSEALAAQVAQSEAVVARLGGVVAERDRLAVVVERMRLAAQECERQVAGARRRKELEDDLGAAQAVMAEIEHNRAESDRLFAERQRASAEIEPASAQVEATTSGLRAAHAECDRAAADVASVTAGTDVEGQAETRALEGAVADAQAALDQAQTRAAALGTWNDKREARRAADAVASTVDAQVQTLVEALTAATERMQSASDELALLRAACRLGQRRKAAGRLERWEAEQEAARVRADEAARKRQDAADRRSGLVGETLPSAKVRQALRRQWDALRMGQAALGGGLCVELDLASGANLRVRVDDGAQRDARVDETIEADALVRLDAGALGSLSVRAGDPGARAAAELARQSWSSEALPVLRAAGVEDMDALDRKAQEHAVVEQEAAALEQEAAVLEAVAAPAGDAADELRAAIAEADTANEAFDPARVAERLEADSDGIEAMADEAEAAAASLGREVERLRSLKTEAATEARVSRERAEAAAREESDACPADTPDPGGAWEAAAQQQGAAQEAVVAAVAAKDAAVDRHASRLSVAHAKLAAAQAHVQAATQQNESARAALAAQHQAVAAASAALDVRKEQAQQHDAFAAAERLARAQDALNEAPPIVGELDALETAAVAAGNALHEASAALDDGETAVRQQQGALQTVGGQVVRERAQLALEALDNAQREEAELALDYDGWKLLLGTLREVENQTGAHLGRALGGAVAERFTSLSGGRYQGASLGADLETQGVVTSEGVQQLDRFSEGVKEQLATLLRVSVAEQLGSMLLLDDHLAQTDPARSAWFRDLLLESSKQIQLVVLTCRPADYPAASPETEAEQAAAPSVHRVDLEQQVQRFSRERET